MHPRTTRPSAAPLLVLFLALGAYACGDDAEGNTGDADHTDSTAEDTGGTDVPADTAGDSGDSGDALDPDATDAVEDTTAEVEADPDLPGEPSPYLAPGPHSVGHVTLTLVDEARERTLPVELWYPAASAGVGGESLPDYGGDEARRAELASLLEAAPAGCPADGSFSTRDEPASPDGPFPLVVFSHCHECTRFAALAIAERMASHGIAVAAPDHVGNTLFDAGSEGALPLNTDTLAIRVADMRFVLDALLGEDAPLPAALALDAERVGAFGHSFGSVTTGALLLADDRPRAAVGIAAPMENPLLPGVQIEDIDVPLLFVLAREDNSISELGNRFIRDNVEDANPPVTLVEVDDAGHWSFSDLCGLVEAFEACCGDGRRQTNGRAFTYLDPGLGREIGAGVVTAFFAGALLGDPDAGALFARPPAEWPVAVTQR
jgi:dienelactone hydrolase